MFTSCNVSFHSSHVIVYFHIFTHILYFTHRIKQGSFSSLCIGENHGTVLE